MESDGIKFKQMRIRLVEGGRAMRLQNGLATCLMMALTGVGCSGEPEGTSASIAAGPARLGDGEESGGRAGPDRRADQAG